MTIQGDKYEPTDNGFTNEGNELQEIVLRPKFIYYFTKHFFPFIFFLMTAFACMYVHDKYAKLIISLVSMILMTYHVCMLPLMTKAMMWQ